MFTIKAEDGAARSGVLSTPHGVIDTPAWLVYTRRGGALNLTPDMLESLQLQGIQLDVLHFLKHPDPSVLAKFSGSGRQFLGLPQDNCVVVATARDPVSYEYSGALRQSTDQAASITTYSGGGAVSPAQYMAAVSALQPDVFVTVGDDVPCDAKQARATAAVDRTLSWLRECMQLRGTDTALQQAMVFASIQGGQFLAERERCTAAVAAEPGVAGFAIGGLGTGESPGLRGQILEAVARGLPAAKPRLLSGLGTPEEVLEAVAQGVDLFDMGYLTQVTAGGYALCFPLSPDAPDPAHPAAATAAASSRSSSSLRGSAGAGGDDTKLNLWALAHRADAAPLVAGCGCYACTRHTRAYLHHLLHTHEMLAQVLLEAHNCHHYQRWFGELRSAVAAGRLAQYREWFLQRRQRAVMG